MSSPLRVLVVDDEAPARARMRQLLDDLGDRLSLAVIGEASDGQMALDVLAEQPADVALIDIRMPRMDGLQLALHLSQMPTAPAIIFVTAFDQYAVKAFELTATDYLLKPVRADRLLTALRKVQRHPPPPPAAALNTLVPEGRQHLRSTVRGKVLLIPVGDILYLRAELKYVTARTEAAEYLLDESLAHLENEFAGRFLRVHRSCLVARNAISGYERDKGDTPGDERQWVLLLAGLDEKIPVSRRQWPTVKNLLEA